MKTRLAVVMMIACGCGSVSGKNPDAAVGLDSRGLDARTPDGASAPCDVTKPFGAPVNVTALNTNSEDDWAWLSADQLTAYFTSTATGSSDRNIYYATRTSPTGTFTTPVLLGGVNTTASEMRPVLTADGLTLFVQSDAAGPLDIYVASRASTAATFGALALAGGVNGNANDGNPWISGDGLTMYLTSDRSGSYDIYRATRASATSTFGTPLVIGELSTASVEDSPVLSSDGLEIFFASNRASGGTNSRNDIWHATRAATTDGFGTPAIVGELSGSTSEDFPTWISPDRCTLLFSSDRAGGNGNYDIWMASRPL